MPLINASHDLPNYYDISGLMCGKNGISTTAVCCLVATSSSECLPNDGEKPNQPKRLLLPKCGYGKVSVKRCVQRFSTQQK